MYEYLSLGPTPTEEPCQQFGKDFDPVKAELEVRLFVAQLRRMFPVPEGVTAFIKPKKSSHDFGAYAEAYVFYDMDDEAAEEYAYNVEANVPEYWDEESKAKLAEYSPNEVPFDESTLAKKAPGPHQLNEVNEVVEGDNVMEMIEGDIASLKDLAGSLALVARELQKKAEYVESVKRGWVASDDLTLHHAFHLTKIYAASTEFAQIENMITAYRDHVQSNAKYIQTQWLRKRAGN